MLNFLTTQPLWLSSIIIGSILMLVVIIFGIIIPLIKPIIKKKSIIYLYSFSTGYFIVLALFGLLRESLESLEGHFDTHTASIYVTTTIIIVVLSSGVIIGMASGLIFRYILSKKSSELHQNHLEHAHSDQVFNAIDIDNPKTKWVAVLLLLSHRIIAGLTLGILVYEFHSGATDNPFNIGLIVAFILHLVPEVLIVYYRQREAGVKMWTAIFNGIIFKLILMILIIVGAYLGQWFDNQYWIIPLLIAASAGAMSFAAIFELIPEILDHSKSSNWYKISLSLISSFIVAIALLSLGA